MDINQYSNLATMYINEQSDFEYRDISPFPIFQWGYGNKQLASRNIGGMPGWGGFFLADSNMPSRADFDKEAFAKALEANGWTRDSFETEGDDKNPSQTIEGWYKSFVSLNQVGQRKRCYGTHEGKKIFGSFDYVSKLVGNKNTRSQYQALVSIPGLEAFAPFVLTFKVSSAMAYEGNRNELGCVLGFRTMILRPIDEAICKANKIALRSIVPLFEFNMPVGVDIDAKGKPVFQQRGTGSESKFLSLPVLVGIRPGMSDKEVASLRIKDDQRQALQELHAKSKEWAAEWEKNDTAAATPAKAEAAPAQAVPEGM